MIQQSPTFRAPGPSFMEDNFSTDWGEGDGFGKIQAQYIQAHLTGHGTSLWPGGWGPQRMKTGM